MSDIRILRDNPLLALLARAIDNSIYIYYTCINVVRNMEAAYNATNCTDYFSEDQITQLALVRIVGGSVSVFVCCLAIVLMVICQAFRSTLQRLYLYITAALTANSVELIFVLDDHSHSYYSLNAKSCALMGFLNLYTAQIALWFSIGTTLYLYHHIRRSNSHHHRQMHTTRFKARLEVFFVFFSVLFPLTYSWIPFIHDGYGASPKQPFCWIRIVNSDCSKIDGGFWYFIILGYIPYLIVGIFGTILLFIITATCCRWVCRHRDIRGTFTHEPYTALFFIGFFIFLFVFSAAQMVTLAFTSIESYGMVLLYAIGHPAFILTIPVLFIVQLYWYRRTSKRSWKNCCREHTSEERGIIQGQSEQQETSPISVNPYVPSHTCTYYPSTSTDTTQDVNAAKGNVKVYGSLN